MFVAFCDQQAYLDPVLAKGQKPLPGTPIGYVYLPEDQMETTLFLYMWYQDTYCESILHFFEFNLH